MEETLISRNCLIVRMFRMVLPALFLVVLQFTPGSFAEQLSAETIPIYEEIIRNPNDSTVLNCTVSSGGPIKSLTWKKDVETLKTVNSSAGPIYWLDLLLNGNRESAGVYTCEAVGKDNKSDTADVAVHIQGSPQMIHGYYNKYSSHSPQAPNVNENLDLVCSATGFPKPHFEWLRNGVKINTGSGANEGIILHRNYEVEKDGIKSILHITAIQKEDNNAYFMCVARNKFGNATSHPIKVIVGDSPLRPYTPIMKAQLRQISVPVGDQNVTLVCTGTHAEYGESTASWKFKGVKYDAEIENNSSYVVHLQYYAGLETPQLKTSLTINNVSKADEGNFTCLLFTTVTGSNPAMDSIYLSVKEISQPAEMTGVRISAWIVGLIVSAVVLAVGVLVAAFVYHFWYTREKKRKDQLAQKYDTDGNLFKNDVFITYSGKDFGWVDEAVIPLFDEHNVRYIIHSRDFVPGKAVADNMADSVYQSRKVLVVMSKNYMASGYCKEEMQMALQRSLDGQGSPVIVIRIDNIKKKELPKSLRNKTFLDYTSREEEQTWQRRLLEIVKVPETLNEEPGENEEDQSNLLV